MELKPGYKQTEVGVIPEEWEAVAVGSLACFTSGCGISVAALCPQSSDYPVPVFGGNGIAGYTKRAIVCEPAVVVGRVGQRCGEVYLTDGPAWITDNALYPRAIRRELDVRFLAMALAAAGLNEVKNRNDLPLVTQTILHAVRIPWPRDMVEQRAIAAALSDVDGLLGGLDRLIAKKRDLKQAAMQQLLTGQTRLPGFDGEWEVMRLGDVATIKDGTHQTPKYVASGIPFFSVEHVTSGDFKNTKFISEEEHQFLTRSFKLEKGDILMTRIGSIGDCKLIDWDVVASFYVSLALLKIRPPYSAAYIAHYSKSASFQKEVELHSLQSAIPKKINLGPIADVKIELPPTIPEQTAIAEVLTEMDAELAALAQRREKTRALKQAMMQELLTGRTRLQGSLADLGNGHATAQEAHA